MSAAFMKFARKKHLIERLEVSESVALDMFQDNPFKSKQIPDITSSYNGKVILYRIGDHIDISRGPMVGCTGIIGKGSVCAVQKIDSDETERMYRFQGIALATGQRLNQFAWGILEKDARVLNETAWSPQRMEVGEVVEVKGSATAQN